MKSSKREYTFAYTLTIRSLFALLWAVTLLAFAAPSQAQEHENTEANEATLTAKWLEVTPPQGWERSKIQEGLFKGCYAYAHTDNPNHVASAILMVCRIKKGQDDCKKIAKDTKQNTIQQRGTAFYLNGDTGLNLICATSKDKKAQAFFVSLAEDAFLKQEARTMLAAFKHFDLPPEDMAPAIDLQSYLPKDSVGEPITPQWGGIQYMYANPEKGKQATRVMLIPFAAHWADMAHCLRNLRSYLGDFVPEGKAWRVLKKQPLTHVTHSRDGKAMLILQCADEATFLQFKAANNTFVW